MIFLPKGFFWAFVAHVVMISGFVGFLFAVCIPENKFEEYHITREIVSLKDNTGISGWYLSVNPTMSYSMYVKSGDGYELITQGTDNTIIKYDSINPRIEYYATRAIPDKLDNFAIFRVMLNNVIYKTIIYVPEGSIKKDFKLDAE
jgi:hypothetical protein